MTMMVEIDKIGSATSPLGIGRTVSITPSSGFPLAGDVVVSERSLA